EGLRRRLKAMVRDGQLFKSPEGYIPITDTTIHVGVIVMEREGVGHLKTQEGQTIVLGGPTLRGLYDGDQVEVQIIQVDKEGYLRGRVTNLLHAVSPLVIGRLLKTPHSYEVLPFDRKFSQNITIPKDHKGEAKDGDIV